MNRIELIKKLQAEEGTIEEAEAWLEELRRSDPHFDSSDAMLYLEESVKTRRQVEQTLRERAGRRLTRPELLVLVKRILTFELSEVELGAAFVILGRHVPHPAVVSVIFHQDDETTAEDILRILESYQPILL